MYEELDAVQQDLPLEIIHLILNHHGNLDRSRQKFRRVCKEWDKFILATSNMWSDVVIDEQSSSAGTLTTLERSLTCPLNLTVILPDNDNGDTSHCAFIPSILHTEAKRIASLHVKGRVDKHFISALWSENQSPMPLLHTVTLIMDDNLLPYDKHALFFNLEEDSLPHPYPTLLQCPSDEGRDVALVDAWGSRMYPALNSVTIVGVRLDWARFPATNLTELRLVNQHVRVEGPVENPTGYHTADVLRFLSPTLEVLEITDFWYDFDPSDAKHWDLIELMRLRSLTLGYSHPMISTGALAAFLEVLQTRVLTELTVTNRRVMSALQTNPRAPSEIQAIIDDAKSSDNDLLYQMILWGWIARIEKLTLNCVVFSGDYRDILPSDTLHYECSSEYEVEDPNNRSDGPKLPFALGFIRTLQSLKHLSVWDPTGHFLYFANYPIAYESTPPYAEFNLSTLETLRIHTPNWFVASAFLEYRKRIQPALEVDVHPGSKRRIVTCECHSAYEFGPMASSGVEEEVDEMVDGWYKVTNGWPEVTLKEIVRRWKKLESEHLGSG